MRAARLAVALVLAAAGAASGAGMQTPPPNFVAGQVRLDGVQGTSRAKPGWIDVGSVSVACDASRRAFFTYRLDQIAPAVRKALAPGARFAKGEVDLSVARHELTDVSVTSVQPAPPALDGAPGETVALSFAACATK